MTAEIMICLAILLAAVALFSWDRIPADVVAIGVMLAILGTGLLTPEAAFAGFGSSTVMLILGFFIMTAALSHTGIVDTVGRWILTHAGNRPPLPACGDHGLGLHAFGLHQQYGGHRLLRSRGPRNSDAEPHEPITPASSPCLRLDPPQSSRSCSWSPS